jgi:ABC-type amino acid transport substrate-binding protein
MMNQLRLVRLCCASFIALIFSSGLAKATEQVQYIHTLGQQSVQEASHAYYQDLLALVLKNTKTEFGKAEIRELPPPAQGDMHYLLMKGNVIDLHRFGTDLKAEQDLLPIRVPLLAGGLGWRGLMIRKTDAMAFSQIDSLSQLQNLTACQGYNWPDSSILEHAGLKVLRVDGYDQMLQMLSKKRCDYFPRSIFEGPSEVRQFSKYYPDLYFDTGILLKYPYAMYFFVKKDNLALAARLERGLTELALSGELQQFMQQHPVTRHVFPISQFKQSLVFNLVNPILPPKTPVDQPAFWLQLPSAARVISVKPK